MPSLNYTDLSTPGKVLEAAQQLVKANGITLSEALMAVKISIENNILREISKKN